MVILTWNFWEITQRFLHFGPHDESGKTATAGKTRITEKIPGKGRRDNGHCITYEYPFLTLRKAG